MDILGWIAASPVAGAMKGSVTLYALVNAGHILALGLVIGAILPLDLRLLGLFRQVPAEALGPFLSRAAATGIALAIVTGASLFSVRPAEYAANPAFLTKIALLSLGIANAILLRLGADWSQACSGQDISARLRLHAAISMTIWIAAVVAGRWIAFV